MAISNFDFDLLKGMTKSQKESVARTLSKRANERMASLERKGINYGAISKAQYWLQGEGRTRFYTGKKYTDQQLKTQLAVLEEFLSSKTSTLRGIKTAEGKRLETFRAKGIKISSPKSFFDFLSSQQFKALSKYVDSDQVVEDFALAADEGYTAKEIQAQYDMFLNSQLTFEQVAELRATAGPLLK